MDQQTTLQFVAAPTAALLHLLEVTPALQRLSVQMLKAAALLLSAQPIQTVAREVVRVVTSVQTTTVVMVTLATRQVWCDAMETATTPL